MQKDANPHRTISGTPVFDGHAAGEGFALNAMCYSFNDEHARRQFVADEETYMDRFGLSETQREAVRRRDVPAMIAAGGNVYYLAKLAGIFGLNVQDLGALQTGVDVEQFKQGLLRHSVTETRIVDGRIAA